MKQKRGFHFNQMQQAIKRARKEQLERAVTNQKNVLRRAGQLDSRVNLAAVLKRNAEIQQAAQQRAEANNA